MFGLTRPLGSTYTGIASASIAMARVIVGLAADSALRVEASALHAAL